MNRREAERSLEVSEEIIAELKAHIGELEVEVDDLGGPRRNEALDEHAEDLLKEAVDGLTEAIEQFRPKMQRALDLEYAAGRASVEAELNAKEDGR